MSEIKIKKKDALIVIGLALLVLLMTLVHKELNIRSSYTDVSSEHNDSQTPTIDKPYVCRAAMAAIMGREVEIMKVRVVGDKYRISYTRPSDGTQWSLNCWFSQRRILWQSVEADGKLGRVRDHPLDEVITYDYTKERTQIHLAFSDGSQTEKSYSNL